MKRGCDRLIGGGEKPVEVEKAQDDLKKFAQNLERCFGRVEKFVDKIGQEFFGLL